MFKTIEYLILCQGGIFLAGIGLLIEKGINSGVKWFILLSSKYIYGVILFVYIFYLIINSFYPGLTGGLAESISIQNALRLNDHLPLYPGDQKFPYNGSLYGPLLPLILSKVFTVSTNYVLVSKLIILILNIITIIIIYKMRTKIISEILILIIMFYQYLTYIRPDILIVFLITILIYFMQFKANNIFAFSFFVSLLALLKISALFYGVILFVIFYPKKIRDFLKVMLLVCVQVYLFFTMFDINLKNWFKTNLKGTQHNINVNNLLLNIFIFLIIFFLISNTENKKIFKEFFNKIDILILFFCNFIVLLIASKNGAGYNHLIPLLLIYSLTLKSLGIKIRASKNMGVLVFTVLIFLIFSFRSNINVIYQGYDLSIKKVAEIKFFDQKYKGIFMGQSGINGEGLEYVNYLNYGDAIQVDYSTFGDLNLTGEKSTFFSEAIRLCRFKYISIPNMGSPFLLQSPYAAGKLLFPGINEVFHENYHPISDGKFFTIYSCNIE